jgi:hypothetical protein
MPHSSNLDQHCITDNHTRTGTPRELSSWLVATGTAPQRIINLWLDPITDQLHCTLACHEHTQFGEPVTGFNIVPAEGVQFMLGGWQPLEDPTPLWSYPGRNALTRHDTPAPAYYQPIVIYSQTRSTHLQGTQHWVPVIGPGSAPRPTHEPVRLIAPSMLSHLLKTKKSFLRQYPGPMMPYDYSMLRVAAKASPWHLSAGFYAVSPSVDADADTAGPASAPSSSARPPSANGTRATNRPNSV